MKHHIQFMKAFLVGLKSLPNPDKYTQAYIRAFEMCLYSAKRNQQKEVPIAEHMELSSTVTASR